MQQTFKLDNKYGIQNRSDRAYGLLREAILEGQFKPGDPLNERVIGERLDIGRTPLRHAFARLVSDGLVEQVRHVGVFVRKLDPQEAIHLIEVRRAMEAGAAALAAEKGDRAAIAELIKLARFVDESDKTATDQELMQREIQFHRQLIRCCGNSEMQRLHEDLHALFLTLPTDGRPGRGEKAASHQEVAQAIAGGDPAEAFAAMWRHMEGAAEGWSGVVRS